MGTMVLAHITQQVLMTSMSAVFAKYVTVLVDVRTRKKVQTRKTSARKRIHQHADTMAHATARVNVENGPAEQSAKLKPAQALICIQPNTAMVTEIA